MCRELVTKMILKLLQRNMTISEKKFTDQTKKKSLLQVAPPKTAMYDAFLLLFFFLVFHIPPGTQTLFATTLMVSQNCEKNVNLKRKCGLTYPIEP